MGFIKTIVDWVLDVIVRYGLIGVFVGSIIEEIMVPIPSPLVMISAGAALLGQYDGFSAVLLINILLIACIGSIGATIGSYFMYSIGYFGGKPMVERTSRFTGVSWKDIEGIQAKLNTSNRDELTIAGLRSIPVMPSALIAITCGVIRVNPFSYTISFFSGGIVRNLIFLIIGWQMGSAYLKGAEDLENISSLVSKIIACLLFIGLIYLYWKRHKMEKS